MHVYWLEQIEANVPLGNEWLSASEVLRQKSMRFAKRRADWLLGRWTAKNAVAKYLQLPNQLDQLAQIEILSAPSGAPEVFLANHPASITISLSHRNGVAACAVAGSKIALGCDLETIEPRNDAFIADYFTGKEQSLVATGTDRNFVLALLWSAKESALKALGTGLRLDTRCVVVCPTDTDGSAAVPAASAKAVSSQDDRQDVGAWEPTIWRPLHVLHTNGRILRGWWQQARALVRTLVADPVPFPPIFLQVFAETEVEQSQTILVSGSATVTPA